jgi:transducin (beta)-like 1
MLWHGIRMGLYLRQVGGVLFSLTPVSANGVGRLFTPSGQFQGIMTFHRGSISAVKFSPSGASILTACEDFTVCLWTLTPDFNQRMRLCFDSHSKEVNDVDWMDDDVFASGANDHTIFIHRANDKRPRFTFRGHKDDVTRIKWSPKQKGAEPHKRLLASVSDDGYCMVWRLPYYPDYRGTNSRSISPVKPVGNGGGDDYFGEKRTMPGIEHCLNRLNVVGGMVNKRMDTLEWSPSSVEGRMILAA